MIIGLTGKNASGKGEVAKFLESRGFQYHSLSDVLRDELKRRHLKPTRDHLTRIGNELREKAGPSVLAERILKKLARKDRALFKELERSVGTILRGPRSGNRSAM